MAQMNCQTLILGLQSDVRAMIATATLLNHEDPGCLLDAPASGEWSVAQILEHLNSYNRYYLPAIERAMQAEKPAFSNYRPGWLGDFFTRLMKAGPDEQIRKKMKSPKEHVPGPQPDWQPVLIYFLSGQQQLLLLLEVASEKNLGSIRVPISISRFIKLKLGDTFRFLVAHQQRHFIQLKNALQARKASGQCLGNGESVKMPAIA